MPYPMHILVNDFAIRSFRDTADKDYVTARMAYRARLIQPFLWSALHSLEKYVKGILVLNRLKAHMGHSATPGIEKMKQQGKFELDLSADTLQFIKDLEDYGAARRYYEVSYNIQPFDIVRFDRAVWELRRYCQPLDYGIVDISGKTVGSLTHELDRIHSAKAIHAKGTCIIGGVLEKIIEQKGHPARGALVWNNLFFGPSRRKRVKMRPDWEAGNSPFFLHPEIIDEVIKYVYIPKDIAEGVRQFAKENAAGQTKTELDAKKVSKPAAKPSERTN
ncbi:hypothetical protein [Achromobacter sp. UMC46]|uniref:hypothetical protein n=1 Tax=Achromobacter sp. UMC46 TaxID=1862319 RepID=UPI0016030B66|nr:hypothetical protein [Achromobacter sp. UMC46]MBB1598240.1 hypothetical protein [Achromobacter sp. UMC46]